MDQLWWVYLRLVLNELFPPVTRYLIKKQTKTCPFKIYLSINYRIGVSLLNSSIVLRNCIVIKSSKKVSVTFFFL
jgi:hypothetical protein